MRILVLAPQPFFAERGTPIALRAIVETLGRDNHEIDLVTCFQGRELSIPGVTIHRAGRPPFVRRLPIGPSWQKALSDLWLAAAARELIAKRSYDVIHGVEEGAILAAVFSARHRIPFVYDMDSLMSAQIRDKSTLLWPFAKLMALVENTVMRRSIGVLAVCPALAEVARSHQLPDRVFLLPDMPVQNGKEPAESSNEMDGIGSPRVLYVGNLEKYQGVDLLVDAFLRLVQHDSQAHLVIVGGSSAQSAAYTRKLGHRKGADRIHFLGPRPLEQLPSLLRAADILVSPRLQGINTPLKIYSYLAAGRPIVATRLSTHTQVLSDDVAMLVDPTPDAMADGIRRLLADPTLGATISAAGEAYVSASFGRDRFEDRLRSFYWAVEGQIAGKTGAWST